MSIFEKSKSFKKAGLNKAYINTKASCGSESSLETNAFNKTKINKKYLRSDVPVLPHVSELETVRHYTNLSRKNFSIDSNFYPLGSCTMKYNPKILHKVAMLPDFLARHPLATSQCSQGFLSCLYELQEMLTNITGMHETSLTPMAGAQGELAGISMIRAYHIDNDDEGRTEMLVPDSAHGTNPATASKCGFTVKEIKTNKDGDLDLNALKEAVSSKNCGSYVN